MKPGRDRFGPVMFLAMAAVMVFSLFGTPSVQGEIDTGPPFALELVSHPAAEALPAVFVDMVGQAELLNVYFAEYELAEIAAMLESPAEHARYESGRRSGVARRSLTATTFNSNLRWLTSGGPRGRPLRS